MYPVFFQSGIPSYGVAMAIGFFAAVMLATRNATRRGVNVNQILDLSFWLLVSSLLGSRLTYVAIHFQDYVQRCHTEAPRSGWQTLYDCTSAIHLWEGGFVFLGGFVLSALVAWWFTRRHRLDFGRVADLVIAPLALAHFFGRLGCFAAGCCYGRATRTPLGIPFPRRSLAFVEQLDRGLLPHTAKTTLPLHPTQLYEALLELGIFAWLTRQEGRKSYHGQLLIHYLYLYPIGRLAIELFRGDAARGYLLPIETSLDAMLGSLQGPVIITLSQGLSIILLVGVTLLRRRFIKDGVTMPPPPNAPTPHPPQDESSP